MGGWTQHIEHGHAVLRRMLVLIATAILAISPHYDLAEDTLPYHVAAQSGQEHPDHASGRDDHVCGPTLTCSPAIDLSTDHWYRLDWPAQRIILVQTHATDLAVPSPDAPVPIATG